MRHRRRWRRNHHLCSNKCKCLLRFRNRPLLRRQVSIRHRLWTRHRRRVYRLEVEVVRRAVDLHPRRRRRHRTRQPRRLHRRILRHLRLRHHRYSSSNRFSKLRRRPSNSFNTKRHHLCNNNNVHVPCLHLHKIGVQNLNKHLVICDKLLECVEVVCKVHVVRCECNHNK